MVMSWRRWCGLCGDIPDPDKDHSDLNDLPVLRDLAIKWFSISARRKCPVCSECETNLRRIHDYSQAAMHIQEMFNELRLKRPVYEQDIQRMRKKWVPQVWMKQEEDDGGENLTLLGVISDEDGRTVRVELEEEVLVDHYLTEEAQDEVENEITIETVPDSNSPSEYEIEEDQDEEDEDEGEEEVDDEDIPEEEEDEETEQRIERELRPKRENKKEIRKIEKKTNSHNVKGPYQKCRFCDRRFRTEAYLKAHERSHEETKPGQLPYSCEHCGKRFLSLSTLMAHVVVHSDDAPFQCDQCAKSFKNKTRLRIHMEIHSDYKWICPVCGLAFNSSHSFNKHKFVHSDQRRHKCPVCPKDFKKQTALKEHLITHTGMRPYSCPFCEKTFINGSSARLHKVRLHPRELAELEASGRSEEVNAKHRNLPTLEELKAHVVMNQGAGKVNAV